MPGQPGTLEIIGRQIAVALSPLQSRLASGNIAAFMAELGLKMPGPVASHAALASAAARTVASVAGLPALIVQLEAAINADNAGQMASTGASLLRKIIEVGQGIADVAAAVETAAAPLTAAERAQVEAFAAELPHRLFDFTIIEYLRAASPVALRTLNLVGLVDDLTVPADPANPLAAPFQRKELHLERFLDLFTQPDQFLRDVYGWGDAGFDGSLLFGRLHAFLAQYNLPVTLIRPPGQPPVLEAYFLRFEADGGPPPPGLTIRLRFPAIADFGRDYRLSEIWALHLAAAARFEAGIDVGVRPPLNVTFSPPTASAQVELRGGIVAEKTTGPMVLLGTAGGNGLFLQRAEVDLGVRGTWASGGGGVSVEPTVAAQIRGGQLKLDLSEGDGFIHKIASGVKIDATLNFGVRWSPSTGVSFEGSSAIEITIPVHVSLGPLEIQTLYLIVGLGADGSIPIELSGAFAVNLGPLQASVDRIGLASRLTFPADGSGNLGRADIAFNFKPPTGVGLAIDTGVVKGGGFLSLDFEKGEYAGALELTIANFISLKAIGLINTRLPGGQPGFSMLIIITAEFSPGFQLGYGFTLIGVGGILGLNRAMLLDPLVQGVRTGAVNSILFPTNIIANAPRILSDLRAIFPPREGVFVIGPMAKIGWGTPTLISVALGVIIEIPGNIVILGRLRVALPTDEAAVLILQVSFVGAIEFDKKRIWFFATLFESRVLFITLEGEMGLLMDFSDNPNFVFSVGGFHPRFTAPALPFPSPARLAISLINESWARVRAEGYFAVTTNSVQMGCRLEAFFGFDAFSVEGHFSFDALIRFSPFYLIVEISVGFSVKIFGIGVWGIHLRASLEGATPWRIRGSAEIEFLFFSFDVDVDVTFGERRTLSLPPIEVLPKLRLEFEKIESWRATLPPSGQHFVSLRDLDSPDDLVLHPAGTLQISQRFAPLNFPLDKVGSQKPSDVKRVSASVQAGSLAVKGPTREKFAPAQYRDMDDAAKLSSPAFESLESGVELSAAGQPWATGPLAQRNVRYETIIIDTAFEAFRIHFFKFWDGLFAHFRGGAAISRAPVSLANEVRMQPFASRVEVGDEQFTVAFQADNRAFSTAATFSSFAEAQAHLETTVSLDPNLAETIHVIPGAEVNAL